MKSMRKWKSACLVFLVILTTFVAAACGSSGGNTPAAGNPGNSGSGAAEQPPASGAGAKADYPSKPITFIVNYGAGGQFDTLSRAIARPLEKHLGQPVVVKNVEGGGGTAGLSEIAKAAPDGYTVGLLSSGPMTINPHRMNVSYTADSFTFFKGWGNTLIGIAVANDSPYQSMKDLMEAAKTKPINVSNTAPGGTPSLLLELLNQKYGSQLVSIPAQGGGEGVAAVLGGHTDAIVSNTSILSGGNELRLLGSGAEQRWPNVPDVPTMKEQGYDVSLDGLLAVGGPAGLSQAIVDIWVEAIDAALQDPEFLEVTEKFATPIMEKDGPEFKQWIEQRYEEFGPIVKSLR